MTGDQKQVCAFLVGEPQGARQRRQYRGRWVAGAALLEARQVVERDARELRQLLPAQAGYASCATRREADVAGANALPPSADSARELVLGWVHVSMMAHARLG
jgi:hypothetical protein